MSEFKIQNSKSALKNSIFFDKNNNTLSYKDRNGLVKAILDSTIEINNNNGVSELTDFLLVRRNDNVVEEYIPYRKQEGLVGGKAWYRFELYEAEPKTISYNDGDGTWELIASDIVQLTVVSNDDEPPSGTWDVVDPVGTTTVSIDLVTGTYQDIIELLSAQLSATYSIAQSLLANEYTEVIVTIPSGDVGDDTITYSDGRPNATGGILSMGSSPIELLPAPNVNEYYDWYALVEYTHVSTNYTFTGDNIMIGGANSYGGSLIHEDFIKASQNAVQIVRPSATEINSTYPVYFRMEVGEGIVLTALNGTDPTLGDGTLRVVIYSKLRTFGA